MEQYKIKHFPTIMLFKGEKEFIYTGGLNKKGVIHWALRRSQAPSNASTCEEIQNKHNEHEFVLAYFGSE
jgi:hypothetical protein